MFKQNENTPDRLLRALIAALALVIAWFWLSGTTQIIVYVVGLVALLTASFGFCGLYGLLGLNTKTKFTRPSKLINWLLVILILLTLTVGSYASSFFTKKLFLEDFSLMNNDYKQTLFNTGQEKRQESIANYEKLLASFSIFKNKYTNYRPLVLRADKNFDTDLEKIDELIKNANLSVYNGDLKICHTDLEKIRPIWQDMLKRNNFSLLTIALVDFHDAMEKVITPADVGDVTGILANYPVADEKLKAVEVEVNDQEIKDIRANLEKLVNDAKNVASTKSLSDQAAILKASFVKVYLKRG